MAHARSSREQVTRPGYRDWLMLFLLAGVLGCGTTRTTDTTRTATEQLLISHSIDDTVSSLDFRALAGKKVFFDAQYLEGVTDKGYLISSLRQHLLACGCLLQEDRKTATYVAEARSGGVGTDRNDLLIGVPQFSVPSMMPGIPGAMVPELPLAKKSNRRGVAKIAVFAYNRTTGRPVWQSGTLQASADLRDSWFFGAGPFLRGSLHNGTEFDGKRYTLPLIDNGPDKLPAPTALVAVTQPAAWTEPPTVATAKTAPRKQPGVIPASANGPEVILLPVADHAP